MSDLNMPDEDEGVEDLASSEERIAEQVGAPEPAEEDASTGDVGLGPALAPPD